MTDIPNRPEDPPPPSFGDSASPIYMIPADTKCPACELPVIQGQTAVETNLGHVVHSYCWDRI